MRDFMPIKSMDGKYIQFDYHPIYLKKYSKYITDGSLIAKQLGVETIKTDIKLEEYINAMKGIYSSCISYETIDESPQAYKDSAQIEKFITPTAKILKRIKPIYNFKNASENSEHHQISALI